MPRDKARTVNPLAPRASKVTKAAIKTKSKARPGAKAFKSAEHISDSDDEHMDDAPAPPLGKAKPENGSTKKTLFKSSALPKNNSIRASEATGAIPTVNGSKSRPRESTATTATSSDSPSEDESSSSDSDDEDDEEEARKARQTTKDANRSLIQQMTNDDSDSSESSDDESDSEPAQPVVQSVSAAINGHQTASADDSSAGESSTGESTEDDGDSDGSSSEESESGIVDAKANGPDAKSVPGKPIVNGGKDIEMISDEGDASDKGGETGDGASGSAPQIRPTTEFKPPSGFKLIKDFSVSASTVDIFNPRRTSGKEIWVISAPASLPITALKEVALDKFAKQQAVMSHDNAHYALVTDPAAKDMTRVLLPSEDGYELLKTPIRNVLQFQQVTTIQGTATTGRPKTTTQVLLDTDLPTKPNMRPQPAGLRMRFRPSGFGDGSLGTIGLSDDDVDDPALGAFRQPPTISGAESPLKKRKEDVQSPQKADKKHKKGHKAGDSMVMDIDEILVPSTPAELETEKREKKTEKKKKKGLGSEAVNGTAEMAEAGDLEKKRRKAEKKERKEKKRLAEEGP